MCTFNDMSLPKVLGERPFDWFVTYYNINLKGNITETPEEAYVMLGGVLPESATDSAPTKVKKQKPQGEKPTE